MRNVWWKLSVGCKRRNSINSRGKMLKFPLQGRKTIRHFLSWLSNFPSVDSHADTERKMRERKWRWSSAWWVRKFRTHATERGVFFSPVVLIIKVELLNAMHIAVHLSTHRILSSSVTLSAIGFCIWQQIFVFALPLLFFYDCIFLCFECSLGCWVCEVFLEHPEWGFFFESSFTFTTLRISAMTSSGHFNTDKGMKMSLNKISVLQRTSHVTFSCIFFKFIICSYFSFSTYATQRHCAPSTRSSYLVETLVRLSHEKLTP